MTPDTVRKLEEIIESKVFIDKEEFYELRDTLRALRKRVDDLYEFIVSGGEIDK